MADAARIGWTPQIQSAAGGHAGHAPRPNSFQHALDRALAIQPTTAHGRSAPHHAGSAIHHASFRTPGPKSTRTTTTEAETALAQAMALENVPQSWRADLHFIMQRESGGQIGARNPVHSARGLFQLTSANYRLNPNGAASFGNGVEEAQGGIRYIKQRYGTAANAVAFWQRHHWY